MIQSCQDADVKLMVGHILRFEVNYAHLIISVVFVKFLAGRAAPIGDHHTAKPLINSLETFQNSGQGHDLQIILCAPIPI